MRILPVSPRTEDRHPHANSTSKTTREVERGLMLHHLIQRHACEPAAVPEETPSSEENRIYGDLPDSFAPAQDAEAPLGSVALVGAGPGDPDLLTVKALRHIQTADVILHDDQVSSAVLDKASPSAEIRSLSEHTGEISIPQDELNALIIAHARAGRAVVHLISGDPMLFGHATEELSALCAAAIPVEIVPGVTRALASRSC